MRRAVEFLVDMLPLDAAGRRAVDETLADWRHEEGTCAFRVERVGHDLRGVHSIVAVLVHALGRDLFRPSTMRTCGWCLLLAAGFGLVMPSLLIVQGSWLPLPLVVRLEMLGLLAPNAMATLLPFALLTIVARGRRQSTIAACVWLCLLSFVTFGWVVPETNQAFRERTALHNNPQPPGWPVPDLPRGEAELPLTTLVEMARQDSWAGDRAWAHLQGRLMLSALLPVCLLLGTQAVRVARARRWRPGGLGLSWAVVMVAYGVSGPAAGVVIDALRDAAAIALAQWVSTYRYWLMPGVIVLASLLLASLASRAELHDTLAARP